MDKVLFPWGAADVLTPVHATTHNVEINNMMTIFRPGVLTANSTLNVTVGDQVRDGARLLVMAKTDATETLALGTGIDAPTIVGVAGKTKCQEFVLVNGTFVATGAVVQID